LQWHMPHVPKPIHPMPCPYLGSPPCCK
jgi:hypothetical protein